MKTWKTYEKHYGYSRKLYSQSGLLHFQVYYTTNPPTGENPKTTPIGKFCIEGLPTEHSWPFHDLHCAQIAERHRQTLEANT